MNASPTHIDFYTTKYNTLFPSARLILIRGTISHMVYLSDQTQKVGLEPVITALRAEPTSPIFLHLFSNSGAQSASTLLRAWKENCLGSGGDPKITMLPAKGIIFDSTPSFGTYGSGYDGISYQIPRTPIIVRLAGLAFVHILVLLSWVVETVSGNPNVLSRSNMDLNDGALVPQDAPRVYMYSKADQLVKWQDVEAHAMKAREKGWKVRREVFKGTGHCKHGKGEGEERYWGAVAEVLASVVGERGTL